MSRRAKKFKYRCMRCRTRNSFLQKLEWYVRPKKCRCCGHTKFYVDKERMRRRFEYPCKCEGCHYPHRPGSSVCLDNPHYFMTKEEINEMRMSA